MIKINLLQNRVANQGGETEIGTAIELGTSQHSSLLTNLALLCGGVLLLYIYQSYSLSGLNEALIKKNSLLSTHREKVNSLKGQSEEAKKAQTKIKAIEKRMEIMKLISKSRLSELKALDYLQTIIPDRVWFTKIGYSNGNFTFDGFSLADDDFNTFMAQLESGGIFVNIVPVRFTEESSGTGKSFTVTCRLGNI